MHTVRQPIGDRDETAVVEPGHRVAEAVARAKGVAIIDLDPLVRSIDPDALETVLRGSNRDVSVTFDYEGHTVRIRSDGGLTLDGRVV